MSTAWSTLGLACSVALMVGCTQDTLAEQAGELGEQAGQTSAPVLGAEELTAVERSAAVSAVPVAYGLPRYESIWSNSPFMLETPLTIPAGLACSRLFGLLGPGVQRLSLLWYSDSTHVARSVALRRESEQVSSPPR